jgi:hypothetical protein
MTSTIPNVGVDRSLCQSRLSSTGVYTCFAIIAYLNDNTTFIYHISSTEFNLEAINRRAEVQTILEKSIRRLNKKKSE